MEDLPINFDNKEDYFAHLKEIPLVRSSSQNKHNIDLFHIHIPKTGGMSIKNYVYGDNEHYNNFGHGKAWRLQEHFNDSGNKEEWDNYYKFAVVRNPWDILWSGYKYTKWGGRDINTHTSSPAMIEAFIPTQIYNPQTPVSNEFIRNLHKKNVGALRGKLDNNKVAPSFKKYVEIIYNSRNKNPFNGKLIEKYSPVLGYNVFVNMPYTAYQYPYVIDFKTKENIVDYIGKFEEMDKVMLHLAQVAKDANIVFNYNSYAKNVTANEVHYKNMYDDDMINMVGKIYKEDIKRFNYDY